MNFDDRTMTMTICDAVIYSAVALFLLCLAVGFPPLMLLSLLIVPWHRRRMEARRLRRLADIRRLCMTAVRR